MKVNPITILIEAAHRKPLNTLTNDRNSGVENMPDINKIFSGDRLKSDDLKKPDGTYSKFKAVIETATIVQMRTTRDENSPMVDKIELKLVQGDKTIIVNRTNAQNLGMMFGNMTENWPGCEIGVSVHQTNMGPGILLTPLHKGNEPIADTWAEGPPNASDLDKGYDDPALPDGDLDSDIPF